MADSNATAGARVCQKRVTHHTKTLPFGDGMHKFYLEECCGRAVVANGVCRECLVKNPDSKKQCSRTQEHGFVTEPQLETSHFQDSPWYHKMVNTQGMPSQEHLEMAKASQAKARGGKAVAPSSAAAVLSAVAAEPPAVVKPKRTQKKKEPATPITPAVTPSVAKVAGDGEKVIAKLPVNAETRVETMDTPLKVAEIIRITLRPFQHGRTVQWRDSGSEKLWARTPSGGRGKQVGRWSEVRQTVVADAPDSDVDGECV